MIQFNLVELLINTVGFIGNGLATGLCICILARMGWLPIIFVPAEKEENDS